MPHRQQRVRSERAIAYEAAKMFVNEGLGLEKTAEKVELTARSILPLLQKALRWNLLRLRPPLNEEAGRQIMRKYKCEQGQIHVVDLDDTNSKEKWARGYVAAAGAELTLDLLESLSQRLPKNADGQSPSVGLGLGAGRAQRDFSRHMGRLLRTTPTALKLNLIAISSGCPALQPEYSAASFFNLFPNSVVASRIGLFAESLVQAKNFQAHQKRPGVKEVFEEKDSVHVVVTAMGDFEDDHDLLNISLKNAGEQIDPEWEGSVQYRPYDKNGAVKEKPKQQRAFTLFELEEFCEMAEDPNKHVVVLARRCFHCDRNRADSLRPLLTQPSLRVWDHIVMDLATAQALLRAPSSSHRKKRSRDFRTCDLFFNSQLAVKEIAAVINRERNTSLRQQAFYRSFSAAAQAEGNDSDLVSVNTPVNNAIADALGEKYACKKQVHVVNDDVRERWTDAGESVPAKAARIVLKKILKLEKMKTADEFVGLGLGPGRATLGFCRHLARLLQESGRDPKPLNLIAISAGCPSGQPEYAVASFFNLIPERFINSCIGMFAETLVEPTELQRLKTCIGVKEAFAAKHKVDIVVTSMGDFLDEHDLFSCYLRQMAEVFWETGRIKKNANLIRDEWCGNMQYRPFTEDGPVPFEDEIMRAVTLFELDELVAMANDRKKHVVLMARKCGICAATRLRALRPLMENQESLRAWSDVVMDLASARALLAS